MRRSGFVFSWKSTDALSIESLEAQKHKAALVQVMKSTIAVLCLYGNPHPWISVKAQNRGNTVKELKITWF
jgi:hypothetical protein